MAEEINCHDGHQELHPIGEFEESIVHKDKTGNQEGKPCLKPRTNATRRQKGIIGPTKRIDVPIDFETKNLQMTPSTSNEKP